MADILKTIALIFKGQDETGDALSKVKNGLKDVGDEADRAKTNAKGAKDEIDNLGKTKEGIDLLKDAVKAFAASWVAKEFIEANLSLERFEKAMVLLKGSTGAAAEEFTYISDLSNRLGINVRSAADAYVQLTAATRGTALEGQPTRDIFEAVSQAMSSLGKSSADTQGALLAISQIVSKGNVSLEELRGQLGERLPGAFQIAAKSMGLTTQELDKLVSSGDLTAEEFLPKFAAALREAFGTTGPIDGFEASLNRLKNALDQTYITLGKAGAFDILIDGLKLATGAITGFIALLTFVNQVTTPVDRRAIKDFGDNWEDALERAANKARGAAEQLASVGKRAADAGQSAQEMGPQITEPLTDAEKAAAAASKETAALQAELKKLNIDPAKVKEPLVDIVKIFQEISTNGQASASQIFAAFEAAVKKSKTKEELEGLQSALVSAFTKGKLSSEEFGAAASLLTAAQDKLQNALGKSAKKGESQEETLRKQAEAAEKAEEKTRQYKLELEKLASNERIKLIEARVQINVAQIEAQSKQVIAAFDSINKSIDSTGDVLKSVFGLLDKPLDSSARNELFDQIERENKFRENSFKLQKELTEAQIAMMRAQTKAMESGDAFIKIDGAGLQPHLEAFMWEILRTIQTRVNRDGLKMLLGAV